MTRSTVPGSLSMMASRIRAAAGNADGRSDYSRRNVTARALSKALANLRAPVFEDKVIDFIIEMADITDRRVSSAELMPVPSEPSEDGEQTDRKSAAKAKSTAAEKKPAAKKKAAAKNAPSKTAKKD